MAYDNTSTQSGEFRNQESLFSKRIKAGKRRTYFFDVRATRSNDYFITITESKKRFEDGGYDRHKMFLYKEDFNKFLAGLTETINFVKTDLMPDFDFDSFSHENDEEYTPDTKRAYSNGDTETTESSVVSSPVPAEAPLAVLDEPVALTENDSAIDAWKI